jgi:hypothetical protein
MMVILKCSPENDWVSGRGVGQRRRPSTNGEMTLVMDSGGPLFALSRSPLLIGRSRWEFFFKHEKASVRGTRLTSALARCPSNVRSCPGKCRSHGR